MSLYFAGLVDLHGLTPAGRRLIDETYSQNARDWVLFHQLSKFTYPGKSMYQWKNGLNIIHPMSQLITFMAAGGFTKLDLAKAFLCRTDLDSRGQRVYIGENKLTDNRVAEAMRDASELLRAFRRCGIIAYDGRSTDDATKAFLNTDGAYGEWLQFMLGEGPGIVRRCLRRWHKYNTWHKWLRDPTEDLYTTKEQLNKSTKYVEVQASKVAAEILGIQWRPPQGSNASLVAENKELQTLYRQRLIDDLAKHTPEENIALAEELFRIVSEKTPYANSILKRYGVSLLMDEQGPVLEEFAQIPLAIADNHLLPKGINTGMYVNSKQLLTHAGKGETDLSLDHADMLLVVEPTIRKSSDQDAEIGVITRHMDEQKPLHPEKTIYGLLVAPTIALGPIIASHRFARANAGSRHGIPVFIPLANDARIKLSRSLRDRSAADGGMREWFSSLCDLSESFDEAKDWYAVVEASVTAIGLLENRTKSITDVVNSLIIPTNTMTAQPLDATSSSAPI